MSTDVRPSRYPFWQVLITLLVGPIGIGVIGSVVVSIVVALAMTLTSGHGLDPAAIERASKSFPVIATSLVMTAIGFIAGPVGLALLTKRPVAETIGLRPRPHPGLLVLAPIGTLALGPTSDRIVQLAERFIPTWTFGALAQIDEIAARYPTLLLLPFLALCPGFGEEIVFRGFIQRWIGRGALAVVVSGLAFAMIHVDPHHVLGVVPLGLYLAWVADRADSTWPTIVAHVTNNAVAVIAVKSVGASATPEHATDVMLASGLGVCVATMFAITALTRGVSAESRP